jgi:hypothetical protein
LISNIEVAIDEMRSQLPADKQCFVRELRAEVLLTTVKYRFWPPLNVTDATALMQDKELQALSN